MQNLHTVWQAIDRKRLKEILVDMIDIYSPSGKEEEIQLYLEKVLLQAGVEVGKQPLEDGRYNLVATLKHQTPDFFLVGHVDTVTAWDLENYGAEIDNDTVRGLGSADMKGGCAAMVEAWLALAELEPDRRPNAGLALVVGEEENGEGSAAFLKEYQPSWVVIGEPTSLAACLAHYGYLEAGLVTKGRRIHSSLPELGHNAVESMLRVLLYLGRDPLFKKKESPVVFSIRELSSSQAGFVVPDRCDTWIDMHLAPGVTPELIQETIERRIESTKSKIPDLDIELTIDFARGYDLGYEENVCTVLARIYAARQVALAYDVFRSHSDANLFFAAGTCPLVLGPGSLETAHTLHEKTSLNQVLEAAHIYAGLCLAAQSLSAKSR